MNLSWIKIKNPSSVDLTHQHEIQKIGLFKFRNIGDVLLMTPAIRAIRESFPKARITAVVNSTTDVLLRGNPHLDEIIVYERSSLKGIQKLKYEFLFFQKIYRQKFDLTLNLVGGERPAWCSLFSGARWRITHYQWWPFWSWRRLAYTHAFHPPQHPPHQVLYQYHLLQRCGIPTPPMISPCYSNRLELYPSAEDLQWADQFLYRNGVTQSIHIHPVSRWLFKCWDDLRMAQIIDWIQESLHYQVILTSGPDPKEVEKAHHIISLCRIKPLSLIGKISLSQTAALIQKSDLFLGVDTAPMHIAAALGKKVIALFGPSGQNDWAPWTNHRMILDHGCPCGPHLRDGCEHHSLRRCMAAITLQEVKEAITKVMQTSEKSALKD